MKNATRLLLLILFAITFLPYTLRAGEQDKTTNITGSVTIKLEIGKVKNIISNATASQGIVNIGTIKQSNITGNVNLDKIKVGEVTNELDNTSRSSAIVKIGSIENSTVKGADIRVDVKKVENKVTGGTNNHGIVRVGAIENSIVNGHVEIDISSYGTITNTLSGGSGSRSEVSIGSIVGEEDQSDNITNDGFPRNVPQQQKALSVQEWENKYGSPLLASSSNKQPKLKNNVVPNINNKIKNANDNKKEAADKAIELAIAVGTIIDKVFNVKVGNTDDEEPVYYEDPDNCDLPCGSLALGSWIPGYTIGDNGLGGGFTWEFFPAMWRFAKGWFYELHYKSFHNEVVDILRFLNKHHIIISVGEETLKSWKYTSKDKNLENARNIMQQMYSYFIPGPPVPGTKGMFKTTKTAPKVQSNNIVAKKPAILTPARKKTGTKQTGKGQNGVVAKKTTTQNSAELGRNLAKEGRPVGNGEAAAHIVASTGSKRHWAAAARSRELLKKYGVNINDAANGIPMKAPRPHNITHTRKFHQMVEGRLNGVVDRMQKAGYGRKSIRSALRRELRSIGKEYSN